MDAKSILTSKTFWFNIVTAALDLAKILPPKYAVPVLFAGNILLRLVSNQPVTLSLPFLK